MLRANDIPAEAYHAGMDASARSKTQDNFIMEKIDVIVATIAFGMGIDKPDVRFVIHYDIPKTSKVITRKQGVPGVTDAKENVSLSIPKKTYASWKN